MGCDPESTIGPAFWGDGVPDNYDRSASVDIFSLNFPGFSDDRPLKDTRIPLVAVDHKHVVKGKTFDDILEVIAWSFVFLAVNLYPSARHDNTPFHPSRIILATHKLTRGESYRSSGRSSRGTGRPWTMPGSAQAFWSRPCIAREWLWARYGARWRPSRG